MSKRTVTRKKSDYPVEAGDLDQQQHRLKKAAAAGAAALKSGPLANPVASPAEDRQAPSELNATIRFSLERPAARNVSVCGDFNNWKPDTHQLRRSAEGFWQAELSLPPGTYQYKFVVDGEWISDPCADQNVSNEFGSTNSVVVVSAPKKLSIPSSHP